MPPLVYIIVLTWNGKEDTLECLHSLRNVLYTNFKVLVVDNNSHDGTVLAVQQQFPDIELICNKENLRFSGGNNVGIQYALDHKADYILLLNNDTAVENNFLGELITIAESDTRCGIAGSKIYYYYDKKRLWYAGGTINLTTGAVFHRGIRHLDAGQFNALEEVDYISGCCMLVKRKVIESVGMLDDAYFIYGEDADWCLRTKNAGFSLLYAPSSIIYHKVSVSSGGHFSWFKNWNKLKSNLRLLWRYAKWYYWFVIPVTFPIGVLSGYLRAKKELQDISNR